MELSGFEGLEAEYVVFAGALRGKLKRSRDAVVNCVKDGELIRVKVKFEAAEALVVIA